MRTIHQWVVPCLFVWQLVLPACSGSSAPKTILSSAYVAVSRGWVTVEGGLRTVQAPYAGQVSEVRARDGDTVEAGQVLVVMDERPLRIRLATAQAELRHARAEADGRRVQLALAKSDAAGLQAAARAGARAKVLAERAHGKVLALEADVRMAAATIEVSRQNVAVANADLENRLVRAPVGGQVLRSVVHAGDWLVPQGGGGLMQILPKGPRLIRAELGEDDVSKVRVGSIADITTDTGTGRTFTAHVIRIAGILGPTTPESGTPGDLDARAVECMLASDELPLLVGQRVIVSFRP